MSIEKVRDYFKGFGIENRIKELDTSSATVELAAHALGCAPERIAKTLSFKLSDDCILIVTAGDVKIDKSTLADFRMAAVVEGDGALKEGAFADLTQELAQDRVSLLALVLIEPVVIDIQVVGLQFESLQLRVTGTEQNPLHNTLFLRSHMASSILPFS